MEDTPLRPTGLMERYNILRNHVKMYNNIAITATYTVPKPLLTAAGSLDKLIFATLNEVIAKHPILGVSIADEGTPEPKFVRLPTIDLSEIVKFVSADPHSNIDLLLQEAHRSQFDRLGELPVWRILIISSPGSSTSKSTKETSFAVGYFCHHGIGDGLSTAAFHLDFLDILTSMIKFKTNSIASSSIVVVPSLPLLPSLEQGTPLPLSILYTLKQVFTGLIYTPRDPLSWTGPIISPTIPRPPICNTRSFTLPAQFVTKILARCREEKTTITSLLTVLVARKLSLLHPEAKRFPAQVPWAMRKFSGHGSRDMGCLVSAAYPFYSAEEVTPSGYISCRPSPSRPGAAAYIDPELWESARATKAYLTAQTSSPKDTGVGLLKFVQNDFAKFFWGKLGQKREQAFEVTNVGAFDVGSGGKGAARIERMLFTQGHSTFACPHIISVASVKGGSMSVAVSWETGVLEDEEPEDLLKWLEDGLSELGGRRNEF